MLNALIPVFALVLLGYALNRYDFPGNGFWRPAERATYFLFYPSLLVGNLARARFGDMDVLPLALALALTITLAAAVLLAMRRLLPMDGPSFSSLFQGAIRFNSYVGLAGAAGLFGDHGLTLAAVTMMVLIPINNLLCVPVVAHFGAGGSVGVGGILRELARNPLILGCLAGFAINFSGLALPDSFYDTLDVLGRTALPLGLLTVGAALDFSRLSSSFTGITLSSIIKLVGLPLLTASLCSLLGVSGPALTVAVIFTALPTAVSSYILARQLGGNTELMAVIFTGQTVLSVITLPFMVGILG